MKHPNHFGRWLACVLLCLLLAGCNMPGEQVQVEELLRAPKLSGDYGDVQTALKLLLPTSCAISCWLPVLPRSTACPAPPSPPRPS